MLGKGETFQHYRLASFLPLCEAAGITTALSPERGQHGRTDRVWGRSPGNTAS